MYKVGDLVEMYENGIGEVVGTGTNWFSVKFSCGERCTHVSRLRPVSSVVIPDVGKIKLRLRQCTTQ